MTGRDVPLAMAKGGPRLHLRFDGRSWETPPLEHLTCYVGLGALAVAVVIERPVASVIAAGHLVNELTNRPDQQALGQALEAA